MGTVNTDVFPQAGERVTPPQEMYYNTHAASNSKPKPERVYTKADRCFAAAAMVLGFLVLKTYLMSVSGTGLGLMASAVSIAVTVFNYLYCRSLKMSGSRTTTVIFIINLLLSPAFLFCDKGEITTLSAAVIFTGNAYFSYASYRESSSSVIFGALRAVFVSPFYEYGAVFGALSKKTEKSMTDKEKAKKAAPVMAGFLISIPLCAVVIILLGAADSAFGAIFSVSFVNFGAWFEEHIIGNTIVFLFSLPISMYIFGAAYSRAYKRDHESELTKAPMQNTRLLPYEMCVSFLSPLSLIYVIFTMIQIYHLFTVGVLSAPGFNYSEYAREGFFQLCAVAVINLAVITFIMFFTKLDRGALPKILRIIVTVFSLLTHCLIITALAKMLIYIRFYGMTPKRIQTSVFMIYLFVMFAVLILKQYKQKISVTKIGYCGAALVIAAMAFAPVDALIVKYNVSQYKENNIPWMGYYAMSELDAGAAEEYAKIIQEISPDDIAYKDAVKYFENNKYLTESYRHMSIWDFNLPRFFDSRAKVGAFT